MKPANISTKKSKAADAAVFLTLVRAALDEAHREASAAFSEFVTKAKRTSEGHIADVCGGAWVALIKPSYKLRTALQGLGQIESGPRPGLWSVSTFPKQVTEQSVTAQEIACKSACEVLNRRLGGEGSFTVHTYID